MSFPVNHRRVLRGTSVTKGQRAGPEPDFSVVTGALRRGQLIVDRVFDEVFPPPIRRASSVHWTPVEVAMRVASLLAGGPNATILDVGAGVGKFCLVAAAAFPSLRVRGVEHRSHFVAIARDAARKMGVDVDFAHGTLDAEDAATVDGIYLFNPFAENLSSAEDHLDESVELNEARFWHDIQSMERLLRAARGGTRVVTYCGWGGEMPEEYRLAWREARAGRIELWIKSNHVDRRTHPPTHQTAIGTTTLAALRERAMAAGVAAVWDGE